MVIQSYAVLLSVPEDLPVHNIFNTLNLLIIFLGLHHCEFEVHWTANSGASHIQLTVCENLNKV